MRVPSLSTARFAVLVALFLVLFTSGIVVGAAGAPLILGQSNSAGGQLTTITSNGSATVLKVNNPGSGRALEVTDAAAVPLKITAPSGKAPMNVNTTNKVTNLHADRLDSFNANGINRLAYAYNNAASSGDLLSGADGHLRATLVTPGAGFVQIIGHGELYTYSLDDTDTVECWAEVADQVVPGTRTWQDIQYTSPSVLIDQVSCDTSGAHIVCGAGTYAIDLEFLGLDADTAVQDATLMAEFIPFNGAGDTAVQLCLMGPEDAGPGSAPLPPK